MSRKLVDLDHAFRCLQSEGSTPEMQLAARKRIAQPQRNNLPQLAVAALPVIVGGFLLWPHGSSGIAWGQVLEKSVKAPRVHSISRYKNGAIGSEEWTEGNKETWILYSPDGEIVNEWRGNDSKTFNYFHFFRNDKSPKNPNQRSFGEIYLRTAGSPSLTRQIGGDIEQLMQGSKYQIIKQSKAKLDGEDVTEFQIEVTKPYPDEFTAVVKESTGLISEIRYGKGQFVRKIDYPASIPAEVFEARPQRVTGIEVYDRSKIAQQIKTQVNAGIGSSKGVTLRLVVLDYTGGLWVVWTGQPVDGQMLHPFTAPGLSLGKPYGLRKLTSSADGKNDVPVFTKDGQRLYGMSREAKTKVGSTVDLDIPTSKGVAHFRKVPVLRLGMPMGFAPWHNTGPGLSPFN